MKNKSLIISAMQEIVLAFTGAFDLDTLLQKIIEIFVKLSKSDRGSIFIYESSTQRIVMSAMHNYHPELRFSAYYSTNVDAKKKIGLTALSFIESKTLVINSNDEIKAHPSHNGKYVPEKQKYKGTDCNALLCIPLKVGQQKPFGVLKLENTIYNSQKKIFTTQIIKDVELLIEIVSKSIQNFESQSRKIDNSIHEILSKVLKSSTTENLSDKLREIAKTFQQVIKNANNVSIWLKEDSKLVCKSSVGYSEELVGNWYPVPEDKETIKNIKEGEKKIGLTPWILISEKMVNIKNHEELIRHPQYKGTFNHILYPDNQDKSKDFSQSFIGVPLRIGEKSIGVIKADTSHEGSYFTSEEEQIFTYLSVITAIIVERDREFKLTQRRDTQLISLYELGTECYEMESANDIFWNLLVGLTHGDGIGYNRAILFKLFDENSNFTLNGLLAIGPKSKKEGQKIKRHFDLDNKPLLDDSKQYDENDHPTSELQSFIESQRISINNGCKLYDFVNKVSEEKRASAEIIDIKECSNTLREFIKEELETYNGHFMALSIIDSDSNLWIGICDNVYSDLTKHDEFTVQAVNIFVNQISLSLSRLSLKKSNEEIEEEAWQEFTKITAHRIGTETGLMSGALNFIKNELNPGNDIEKKLEKDLDVLDRSLSNLKKAVNEYTQLQKPRKIEKNQKIRIGEILRKAEEDFKINQSLQQNPVQIHINCGYELPLIYGDFDTISYAFREIFDNAIKAMPDGGEINVYSFILDNEKSLKIVISDTGTGIDDKFLSKIFERGFKNRYPGTGLGLHIVKRNIELNGGKVWAENNQNTTGASFLVVLPIRKFLMNKILIVEDNQDNLDQIYRSIKSKYPQIKLISAKNEFEAISILDKSNTLKEEPYDCIVADIDLKDKGGTEFGGIEILNFVRRKQLNLKFIIISANEGRIYKTESDNKKNVFQLAKELGAFACISRIQERNYLDELIEVINA